MNKRIAAAFSCAVLLTGVLTGCEDMSIPADLDAKAMTVMDTIPAEYAEDLKYETVAPAEPEWASDIADVETSMDESQLAEYYKEAGTPIVEVETTEEETEEYVSPYIGETALANVENYVNVRTGPSTEYDIVGKIYNFCAAEILDDVPGEEGDGRWFRISSGSVDGYIKASLFLTGDEAEAMRSEVGVLMGTVKEDYLRVRSAPDLTDPENVFTYYERGTEVFIDELTEDGWAKITSDESSTGYVYAECLDIERVFKTAISLEEEAAEIERREAAEEAARLAQEELDAALLAQEEAAALEEEALLAQEAELQRQQEEAAELQRQQELLAQQQAELEQQQQAAIAQQAELERQAAEQAEIERQQAEQAELQRQQEAIAAQQAELERQQREAEAAAAAAAEAAAAAAAAAAADSQNAATDAASAQRNAVVQFALQFVGNPYVHGGRSLVTGTDCSGFTSLVYQNFGYSLSYTPEGQSGQGTRVDISQLQPGDLLFYSNNIKYIGHVAIYIGNGQIVHAGNESTGIIIGSAFYREPLFANRIIN